MESSRELDSYRKIGIKRLPWLAAGLVVAVFLILGIADLSNTETVLLGVVQTVFSIFAGWGLTHAYAKDAERKAVHDVEELHQRNLRTYALKAAEKVENLSRELNRLVIYLDQELEEADYESVAEELSAKEERIQSAIHILNTLKSVNDTSLSDWRGVIGNEIDEIRQKAEQREDALEKIVGRIERLESEDVSRDDGESERLLREMDKLRRDLRFVAGDVTGNLWSARKSAQSSRQIFHLKCPVCQAIVIVRQKLKEGAQKGAVCAACGTKLVSVVEGGEIVLRSREVKQETFECPSCSKMSLMMLDEILGSANTGACDSCGIQVRIARSRSGISATILGSNFAVTEQNIEAVKSALPQQPWKKGIHEEVALQLGLPMAVVKKSIAQLILRGVFKDQFRGVLCTPEEKLVLMRSLGAEVVQGTG